MFEKIAWRWKVLSDAVATDCSAGAIEETLLASKGQRYLDLRFSEQTVLRLLLDEQLCAADFCCLDCQSKECLWRLMLMSCKEKVAGTACAGCIKQCERAGDEHASGLQHEDVCSVSGPRAVKFSSKAKVLDQVDTKASSNKVDKPNE